MARKTDFGATSIRMANLQPKEAIEGKEVGVWRFWNPDGTEEPSTNFN